MALFASVPRELYDEVKADRDRLRDRIVWWEAKYTEAVAELMAVKRHDLGMIPSGLSMHDPVRVLGPATVLAIEEMSAGYQDLQGRLTNTAVVWTNALKGGDPARDVDDEVAQRIREGDEA